MNLFSIKNIADLARFLLLIVAIGALSGCATGTNPNDPFEPWNRRINAFNEDVDEAIVKPVATVYSEIIPHFVRTGVSNFFDNLTGVWTAVNSVLQLKPQAAAETVMRVATNTFFGLGGILDVASEMNIDRHKADFGQTLGHWGVPPGPYLVLPLLGPSTMRDTLASTLIAKGDLVWQINHVATRNSLYTMRLIDKRSNLLRTTAVLDAVALDKYSFTRDIFLQVRRNEVFDGNEPDEVRQDLEKPAVNPPGSVPEAKPDAKLEVPPPPDTPADIKSDIQVPPVVENKTDNGTQGK
ncbi:MAG: VacJ family lipoprotein [Burkholderiaceae bacterium]|nr:VacJ family lipoprotein [Burkholderiaceae bacterium]